MTETQTMLTVETERPRLAVRRAGKGPNYVLLHGGMGSWNHWARNIEALAEHFSVHAVDLPGYGASPDVDRDISGEDYRALVCRAIGTMFGEGEEFRLTGFSFGSVLCSHVAAQFGDRVAGLSLIGASGFGPPEGRNLNLRSYKSAKGDPDLMREIVRENLLAFMLTDPATVDDTAIRYHGENVRRTRFDSRKVSWSDTQCRDLAEIKCQLLLIWGERDITAYPSLEERVARCRAAVPGLRLDTIPGASHWAMYDSAAEVNQLLLDFHRHR